MSFNKRLATGAGVAEPQFKVKAFTGNRPNSQSITGVGFEPAMVIVKLLAASGYGAVLANQVRGAQKFLDTTSTAAEVSASNSLTSFDSDGFSVGGYGNWNGGLSGANGDMISYSFKKGTDFSGNSNGSITSSGNANNDLGISIVDFTGTGANATVGHGLSSTPEMYIVKSYDTAGRNWSVFHQSQGNDKAAFLHTDGAFNTTSGWGYGSGTFWNTTSPTSTTISLGSIADMNGSGNKFLAFCFASKAGVLKVGSYSGSNSNFQVTTGFQPSFVMVKNATVASTDWTVFDDQKSGFINFNDNSAMTGSIGSFLSFNATGFELVGNSGNNVNTATNSPSYIYLAIK